MQEVLVLPRERFQGLDGFLPWERICSLLVSAEDWVRWMPRPDAERSELWIQPIPCSIFRDTTGRYCIFRQARQQRNDLSRRISLVIGGHIDQVKNNEPLSQVFEDTARREVLEEVGVNLEGPMNPVGMVVDATSIAASKHIGFVYESVLDADLKSLNSEEFSVRSKYNGQFISVESLSGLSLRLDPWSHILLHQYLNDGFPRDTGRQSKMPVFME